MNLRKALFVTMIALSLMACSLVSRWLTSATDTQETSLPPTSETPVVINHPKPDLGVDVQPFIDAGCSGENLYVMECAVDSPLRELGCDFLRSAALVGGLDPAYPAAICLRREMSGEPPDPSSFQMTGCMAPLYQSTVISVDGEFRLVSSSDDFQAYFEPIESEDEALSYAQLVTGWDAVYGRQVSPAYTYRAERIEDTYVVKTEDGYLVSLFSGPEPLCGCGVHTFYQQDVLVRPDGQVEVIQSTPLYDLEVCID